MSATKWVALVEQYLAHRRSLGFSIKIEGAQLLNFARFMDAEAPHGPLTTDIAVRWATQPGGVRPVRFPEGRITTVRPFARYCATFDNATEIPPLGLVGPARRRPLHHIYDEAQLGTLIAAAQRLSPSGGLRPLTYATLFGLLAASGLRISEALRLTVTDVDLTTGVLTIRCTKFRKDRLVPLHPTACRALRAYAAERDRLVPRPKAIVAFFTCSRGEALRYRAVAAVFYRLRVALGWDSLTPWPRIHDLRHTFACKRIERWYDEETDVAWRIPSLATYLGHACVSATYWYLTATPTLLSRAARRFEAFGVAPGGAL